MQFSYDEFCGGDVFEIKDEVYNYIVKARRHKVGDEIYFRNLKDSVIYLYKIEEINKKNALLRLVSKEEKIIKNPKSLHLGWCVIDVKNIEKTLPSLNELGVDKITFIYCEYSQKNFKINIEKLNKILINSSTQCGRSDIIKLEVCNSLEKFLKENSEVYFLDFSQKFVDEKKSDIKTLVIGCEGGFSNKERIGFDKDFVVGFDLPLILRSETAIITATSKIIA